MSNIFPAVLFSTPLLSKPITRANTSSENKHTMLLCYDNKQTMWKLFFYLFSLRHRNAFIAPEFFDTLFIIWMNRNYFSINWTQLLWVEFFNFSIFFLCLSKVILESLLIYLSANAFRVLEIFINKLEYGTWNGRHVITTRHPLKYSASSCLPHSGKKE